jgi:DNA-binding NarL/FixJ family response regulator
MQAVIAADPVSRFSRTTERVAVVATDELLLQRIRDSLRSRAIDMLDSASNVADLPEDAGQAAALVLVGDSRASRAKALVRAAVSRFPDVPVVLIDSFSTTLAHRALEAGAAGLVPESRIEPALLATIRAVCAGQLVAPRDWRRSVVRVPLSHRERETLALLVKGLTNREIAGRLFLAESTVKTHLTSIFNKLGVGSRNEAAALALDPELKLGIAELVERASTTAIRPGPTEVRA